ncbi:PREDICTED: CBL-interacting serine/threonine-protein kinase 7-like [Ipomoea nil]|uniref:CBL-interacting serine/threonine-protein kinase 7-like n=1 Tax=Ipomoea nil TaxID=35883 RepID=UPI0009011401|nr:PREDICTED: CBL-interacting serine/threonine-protein kinase 7-like [Ipomoea nil]
MRGAKAAEQGSWQQAKQEMEDWSLVSGPVTRRLGIWRWNFGSTDRRFGDGIWISGHELCSIGGEQFEGVRRRKIFLRTARYYFHQLVFALHFCHQNGVTHRDIKPQNLLLDKDGKLKISDFGLSALPEQIRNGLLHTACGTPAYTAPEVMIRKGYDGAKADAWSCGVILFAFLAGYLPFDDSNISNMYRAIRSRAFQFPDWITKPTRSIIFRLLDPNPVTRMSIEELMKLPWFKKSSSVIDLTDEHQFGNQEFDKDCKHLTKMNAFDIISMSPGLDLSGLFQAGLNKKEMRFTTNSEVGEVEEKVKKIGSEAGYRVERGNGGGIRLVKARVTLMVEILQVAPELWLVEMKVVNGEMEFEDTQWEELRVGFKEISCFMLV